LALTADLDARPNLNRGKSDPAALDSAWRSLLRQLDAHDTRRPASFAHTPLWAVHATPGFASIKDGEPSHEEENELVERLNAAAEKGEPSPLTIQQAVKDLRWSVAPEAKLVGETPAQWERSIAFSRPAEVQQGTVELVLEDIFGQRVTRRQKAWSHVLQASPDALAAELPELVAAVAGVERGLLDAKGSEKRVHDEAAKLSPQASQAELVAHMVRRSSRDGVVTPDELRVLMNLAKELASIPGTDLMNDPIPISDSASDE
jgi:hypothetical protein